MVWPGRLSGSCIAGCKPTAAVHFFYLLAPWLGYVPANPANSILAGADFRSQGTNPDNDPNQTQTGFDVPKPGEYGH
jgi:hypothetical protein